MTSFKGKSRTELLGYNPLEKRIAMLQISGIRTMAARDDMFDHVARMDRKGREIFADLPEAPPLPRHMEADMADVSELWRAYSARRSAIDERVKELRAATVKLAAQQQAEGSKGPLDPLPPEASKS